MPSGPIEPATYARPFAAARASFAPSMLIAWSLSAIPKEPSLIRFAPNVFVSMMSAPARTYSRWTSVTSSGALRFNASKLLLMKTPFAYSMVPIAPSQTSTRSSRASRKGCNLCVEPFALKRVGVHQKIRLRHQIESDGADALPDRIGELVMMAKQMQPRFQRGQHVVQDRFPMIDAAPSRIERARRFVREK